MGLNVLIYGIPRHRLNINDISDLHIWVYKGSYILVSGSNNTLTHMSQQLVRLKQTLMTSGMSRYEHYGESYILVTGSDIALTHMSVGVSETQALMTSGISI